MLGFLRRDTQRNLLACSHDDRRLLLSLNLVPAVMVRENLDDASLRLHGLRPRNAPRNCRQGRHHSQSDRSPRASPHPAHWVMYLRISRMSSSVIMARTRICRMAAAITRGGNLWGA